jgi:hypothetical protein
MEPGAPAFGLKPSLITETSFLELGRAPVFPAAVVVFLDAGFAGADFFSVAAMRFAAADAASASKFFSAQPLFLSSARARDTTAPAGSPGSEDSTILTQT